MTTQVTVTLPDDTARRAEYLAHLTDRDVADILAETIALSLDPLSTPPATGTSVEALPDAEVLEIADSSMDREQDQRMQRLLELQQASGLTTEDHAALFALGAIYQDGLLRKAQALRVAVQRGLRPPLTACPSPSTSATVSAPRQTESSNIQRSAASR